jgi:hemerythrin superfamily protein
MSIVSKALEAITPSESEEKRAEATRKARAAAGAGDWLSLALEHHDRIRAAFAGCRQAEGAEAREMAVKRLALVLTGHSQAEEMVLYPALAETGEKGPAEHAYAEQAAAKMQMAELERIAPSTPDWLKKVEHIREAVLHHMYEEEDHWFIRLKEQNPDQALLTRRFREEFERYVGSDNSGDGGLLRESEDRSWDIPETRPESSAP